MGHASIKYGDILSFDGLSFLSVLGLDTDDRQKLATFLPSGDERVTIGLYQALHGLVLHAVDGLELHKGVVEDGLVDDFD